MPFEYTPFVNPYGASIADTIARSGDAAAHAAEMTAQAQARAAEIRGQAWGGAAQAIGQIPNQIVATRDAEITRKLKQQELSARNMDLQERTQQHQQANVQRLVTTIGRIAGASKSPEDFASGVDDLVGLGSIPKEVGDRIKAHAATAGPDGWTAMQSKFVDSADQYQQAVKVGEGDKLIRPSVMPGRPGAVVAEGAPKPPTVAELALKAGQGDQAAQDAVTRLHPPPRPNETDLAIKAAQGDADAIAAMAILKPGPKKTEAEHALDAYAQYIGKKDASELTYQDRQTFDKDKAKITSDQAYQQHMRERQYDIANPVPEKAASQDKLEQNFRTVLARAMSSRSGGIGLEDQKVGQANHLLALLEQTYDPKTDTYNLPKTLQGELAAGLARLVAPGGNVGIEMMREFDQRTAKGDLAGALTYVTGHPFPTATQDFAKLLKDSIERQGAVAEQNREGSMSYLRALVPTELEESRRLALETATLNPLRQSRVAVDAQGNRKLFTSTDGGKTWK